MIKPIGRGKKREGEELRRIARDIIPRGWRRDALRASGGSLEELQQFRNCFPFFCSLNCFPRSAVLFEAVASLVGSLFSLHPLPPWTSTPHRRRERERVLTASTVRRTFRYYRFFAGERSGRVGQKPEKAFLLSLGSTPSSYVSSYGRVTALAVRFRSTFFRIFDSCIIYTGAIITTPDRRRLPKRSRTYRRETRPFSIAVSRTAFT